MATKRKVKRYDEGGMTDDEVASFAGTPENESNAGMKEAYKEPEAEAKVPSFKEAFAAARKAGDKTFEWNGKKFTSELASEKKAAPKAEPKAEVAEEKPKLRYQSLADRARSYEAEREKAGGVGMYGTTKREKVPVEDRVLKNPAIRKSEQKFMGSLTFNKGGSVSSASRRGDGIATKGKTRGKMV